MSGNVSYYTRNTALYSFSYDMSDRYRILRYSMKKMGLVVAAVALLGVAVKMASSPLREVPSGTSLRVVRVIDGDTIVISDGRHIRFTDIDTPEEDECYTSEATALTEKLLLNKRITLQTDVNGMDRFGRTLAYVYLSDGTFANKYLLEHGAGMFFYDNANLTHTKELIDAAEQARMKRVGLWNTCGPCTIKGNYDTSGRRWYHLPQFRHYPQVIVNLDHADRWFCTEADAIKAGFTRAQE